jgi:hypothetical protein
MREAAHQHSAQDRPADHRRGDPEEHGQLGLAEALRRQWVKWPEANKATRSPPERPSCAGSRVTIAKIIMVISSHPSSEKMIFSRCTSG